MVSAIAALLMFLFTMVFMPSFGGRLSNREVAELFGVSRATVYGFCALGFLRHVRVVNVVRVHPNDLRELLTRR